MSGVPQQRISWPERIRQILTDLKRAAIMSQKDSLSKLRNFFRYDKNASGKLRMIQYRR